MPGVRAMLTSVSAACLILGSGSTAFADSPGQSTGGVAPVSEGSQLVQDPQWVALKEALRIVRGPEGAPMVLASPATLAVTSKTLSYTTTKSVVEPEGRLYDDAHHAITDQNYWNFCSAGAATVTMYYWRSGNVTGWAAGNFKEPYGPEQATTYWRSSDTGTSSDTSDGYATVGRAYLMYMAEQVRPPSYSSRSGDAGEYGGMINFTYYRTHGAAIADIRDALNWEASGHSGSDATFFYLSEMPSSQVDLHDFVVSDIVNSSVSVVADVDAHYLPNWSVPAGTVNHSITIIGFNDTAGTFSYLDTCDALCGSSSNSGKIFTTSQSNMYQAITHETDHEGIVW